MNRPSKAVFLFVILSSFFLSRAQADLVVFTDRVAWQNAVDARRTSHVHFQDFEGFGPGGLSPGFNDFHPFEVDIPGTPGFNAIDDSFTNDPFMNALSPNGSTYYLGDVGVSASKAPVFSFVDYPPMYKVIGFGADWVVQGDLVIEVRNTTISFSTYLPSGSGFLGVLSDEPENYLDANLSGSAVFGMDDIETGNVTPEPSSFIFASVVVVGLVMRRRRGCQ